MTSNFFRQYRGFFIATIKSQLRTPSALFFGFLFPIIFLLAFGFFGANQDSKIDLGLVPAGFDREKELIRVLENSAAYNLTSASFDDLSRKLENGDIDAFFYFTTNEQAKVVTNANLPEKEPLFCKVLSLLGTESPCHL